MHKIIRFVLLVLLLFPEVVFAEGGLWGERRLSFGGGYVRPGNEALREFDSSGLAFFAGVGLPATERVDFTAGFSHLRFSESGVDITVTSVGGGILYHFETSGPIRPAVSMGGVFNHAEASAGTASEDDSEFGFSVGLGFEAGDTGSAALGFGANYMRMGGKSSANVGGSIVLWISDSAYLGPAISYGFDEGDVSVDCGVGFKF